MGQITCSNCGTANDSGYKFCVNCGASLPTESADSTKTQSGGTQGDYQQSQGGYQQNQGSYQQNQGGYQQAQSGYQQNQGGYYQQNQGGYQQYQGGYQPKPGPEQKSKLAAGLLGIFLGELGIHNFYLGYKNKALAQLLITILSCGFLSWATWIWGLVEGIMILSGSINVDANGVPLKE